MIDSVNGTKDSVRSQAAPPVEAMPALGLLWEALAEDSGADIAIFDRDGCIRCVAGAGKFWPFTAANGPGKRLDQFVSAEIASERQGLIARCCESMRPVAVDTSWRGAPARTVLRPFKASTGEVLVLAVCRGTSDCAEAQKDHPTVVTVKARAVDAGPLSKLTPREIEVLALIAQGHTTAAIAKMLFRSAKTIEAHRLSLGLKLRARNRVELARIAIRAGLHKMAPRPSEPRAAASDVSREPAAAGVE